MTKADEVLLKKFLTAHKEQIVIEEEWLSIEKVLGEFMKKIKNTTNSEQLQEVDKELKEALANMAENGGRNGETS